VNDLIGFMHMGGYAFYVWSAYGLTLVVLALNIFPALGAERRALRRLARLQRRKEIRS
jgi:heme exporter protein D